MNAVHHITSERENMNITDINRLRTEGRALAIRSGATPIADDRAIEWTRYTGRLPLSKAYPVGESSGMALLLVAATHHTQNEMHDIAIGHVRSVVPNTDPATSESWPWRIRDRENLLARGWVVNDAVHIGERVWMPGQGIVTVDGVARSDGAIRHITVRGSSTGFTTWFREDELNLWSIGDLIVVEDAACSALVGNVYPVVDQTSGGAKPIVRHDGGMYPVSEFIVVKREGKSPEPGALLVAREINTGATAEYRDWARRHVFKMVEPNTPSIPEGAVTAQALNAFSHILPAGHNTTLRTYEVVGHVSSKHSAAQIERHTRPGTLHEHVVDAGPADPENDDRTDWKAEYKNLVEALRDEAEERGWCDEYEEFVEKAGVIGGAREKEYDVTVSMSLCISASDLDDLLRPHLNSEGEMVDVRDSIDLEHQGEVRVTTTAKALNDGDADDLIASALRSKGYRFDSFEVLDHNVY